MKYEIKDNVVYVYDENEFAFISQHHHPDLVEWANEEQMIEWAENFIANFNKVSESAVEEPVND